MTERRSSILSLDSEAVRFGRLIVKTATHDVSALEAIIESHDKLTKAILAMRDNAEMALNLPRSAFILQDSIELANEALLSGYAIRPPVRMIDQHKEAGNVKK